MSGTRITVVVGALLLMALVGSSVVAQSQKSAEELYQSALVMKEGRGDLEGAIKLFAKILADFPKERSVTGKAQLQIGLCYEKLGEAKAQDAYGKVIANFQDQPETVKVARERLDALVKTSSASPSPSAGMTLRQVDYPDGPISPDGRWIALGEYAELSDITLYDTKTKLRREITRHGEAKNPFQWIDTIEWAPSSKKLAYVWQENATVITIRVVDVAGAEDRTVFRKNGGNIYFDFVGWSPDEKTIFLVVSELKRSQSIGKCSIATGEFKEIKKYEGSAIGKARISPDGRFVAFGSAPEEGTAQTYKILTLSIDQGKETVVYEHPLLAHPATWTPDGERLLFTSRRSGTDGRWSLPLQEGKAGGEPRLVREFSNSLNIRGFVKGSLYVLEFQTGGADSFMAQVDLETGKTLKAPEALEKDYKGVTSNSFWSSDGRWIAYLYQSSHRPQGFAGEYDMLRIRSLDSQQMKEFHSPVKRSYSPPRWSPDGESIFIYGMSSEPGNKSGLFRINAKTGETALLINNRSGRDTIAAWSSDGKTVYWEISERGQSLPDSQFWLTRMRLDTKEEKEIFRAGKGEFIGGVQLSDDEQWLGFQTSDLGTGEVKFCVLPAQGGNVRIIYQNNEKNVNLGSSFFWGPPGKGILFRKVYSVNNSPLPAEIWHIPSLVKAEPRKLDLKVKGGNDLQLRFNPDGKTIAFKALGDFKQSFWILENFLPSNKSEK
jgi:Tol biopolymer transport system component